MSAATAATDGSALAAEPSRSAAAGSSPIAESARETARGAALWLARGVDSWFGDRPFEDGGRVSDGRLDLSLSKREGGNIDVNLRFNARFRLPNVPENTYVFFGRDRPPDVVADTPGSFTKPLVLGNRRENENNLFAGLGRRLSETFDVRLGVHGALKPYAQARYRQPWQLGPTDLVELRQTFFWNVDDRLGSTTALSYEHGLSPTLVARWLSSATWTQDSQVFDWNNSLGLHGGVQQQLWAFELLSAGRQHSGVAFTELGLQGRWQQPLYQNWLLGELVVGHFWSRTNSTLPRTGAWEFGTGLKLRF